MTPNRKSENQVNVPPGFVRVAGLFRRADFEPVDKLEASFYLVDAGTGPHGEKLVALFQGKPSWQPLLSDTSEVIPISVEILLPALKESHRRLTVRYCDKCHRWGQHRSTHLCGINWHHDLAQLVREIVAEASDSSDGRAA